MTGAKAIGAIADKLRFELDALHRPLRTTDSRYSQLTTAEIVRFVKRLLATLEALDRNARAGLALEMLMLDLPTVAVQV